MSIFPCQTEMPQKEIKIVTISGSVKLKLTSILGKAGHSRVDVVSNNKTIDSWIMNNALIRTLNDPKSFYWVRLQVAIKKAA